MRIKKQLTIDELAERLALSRTTIYYWVRDLPFPTTREQTLAARRAGAAMHRRHQELRRAAYREGEELFERYVEQDPIFRDFVCMYIRGGVQAGSQPGVLGQLRSGGDGSCEDLVRSMR